MHKSATQPGVGDNSVDEVKALQSEIVVLKYIHDVRKKAPGIGGLKLWHMYRRAFGVNHPVGRDRFEDIVSKYGLKVRARVRQPQTTDSTHGLPLYPNLIKDFIPDAPDQLWVSDITYITLWPDDHTYVFCYLSLILDAYTEEIVGWSVGPTLETTYPMAALRQALKRIKGPRGRSLIHHSDRGCQYASNEYLSVLKRYGIRVSMTESGDPKENAQAERINNTMKNELLKGFVFRNTDEVKSAVAVAVDFYNRERPHRSINMMTPREAAGCSGEIQKRWTSYRLIAIKSRQEGVDIAEKGLPLELQGLTSGLRPPVNPCEG
jgi:transposase InsO family protein